MLSSVPTDEPIRSENQGRIEYRLPDGRYHRIDGPAIQCGAAQAFYHLGKLHRLDGPAREDGNGSFEYWVLGEKHRTNGPAVFRTYPGRREWWQHGVLHCVGAPAVIQKGGFREWYFEGKLHRNDGPAIENGSEGVHKTKLEVWFHHGKKHRLDGPADFVKKFSWERKFEITEAKYFVDGIEYSEQDYPAAVKAYMTADSN